MTTLMAWFIGITPKLVTGVRTGCENRSFSIHSTQIGQGANSALPIFAEYMKKVYANTALGFDKNLDFERPKTEMTIELIVMPIISNRRERVR